MKEATFTPIDLNNWSMSQEFYYYTTIAPTSYSVTVKIDITKLHSVVKEHNIKFFPVYLYLVTKVIKDIPELRVGLKDEVLGHWDILTPAYPQFHEDNKTTSLLFTEYTDNFSEFYNNYISDTEKYGNSHGILSAKGVPPQNSYVISCIPWFTFESFSLHNHRIKDYYFPSFEAGAFVKEGNKLLMPLSITVHHATTDGYHIKVFLEKLQYLIDNHSSWLNI